MKDATPEDLKRFGLDKPRTYVGFTVWPTANGKPPSATNPLLRKPPVAPASPSAPAQGEQETKPRRPAR